MPKELLERGSLANVDPLVTDIIGEETARQEKKLILIASESICPAAVREALASPFSNIYAEGYPGIRMVKDDLESLADMPAELAHFARLSDRRYYRGCEYADLVEAVAQRRLAEIFATDEVPAERLHCNVQPLSGAAANNAVYEACVEPGGTVLGMALASGGHLTHGSPVNRSGKHYRIVSYGVTGEGAIDYDGMRDVAMAERPQLIIAGFSAYPWDLDWPRLRRIADECGAKLLADVAHTAGLIAGKVVSSPIGHAHVVSHTTHKTLCGPRGAAILTADAELAKKIDTAVFPGEQGGPHINAIAAKAVCFKLAASDRFKALQQRVLDNAKALAAGFVEEGVPVAYGGTNTHMVLIDCSKLSTASGGGTSGELLARVLDAVGIVVNKNTIAGDDSPVYPSAVRFGTTWVSQRGLDGEHMRQLAALVGRTTRALQTYRYHTGIPRAKLDLAELEGARAGVQSLVMLADSVDTTARSRSAYPFPLPGAEPAAGELLLVRGRNAAGFLHGATTADVLALEEDHAVATKVLDPAGEPLATVALMRLADEGRHERALVYVREGDNARLLSWLRGLSDGTARFDDDLYRKVPGPVAIDLVTFSNPLSEHVSTLDEAKEQGPTPSKGYFVGEAATPAAEGLAEHHYEAADLEPRKTPMYDWHAAHTSRGQIANFAGWLMPVYFKGIREEHRAVRERAGLFDVAHMGVLEVAGRGAARFLDLTTTNAVTRLRPGRAQYSYLLAPDGRVIDDILVYKRAEELFMVVVNAANAEEDEAWLRAVLGRDCCIDPARPARALEVDATLRNLKDPAAGDDRRVDSALQGPRSLEILLSLAAPELGEALPGLRPFGFAEGLLAGIPAIVSRTGYTGEPQSFEVYVHPEAMPELWEKLFAAGEPFGLEPAGLGARDSTRTEAGLPLHGHELAGDHGVNPIEAGYGSFVKLHKPWFVGRHAMVDGHEKRHRRIVRFEVREPGGRMVRNGAPVVDSRRGKVVGEVTSCAKVDDVQVGMALLPTRLDVPGTRLDVFPVPSRVPAGKSVDALTDGDAVVLPRQAVVVDRFRRVE